MIQAHKLENNPGSQIHLDLNREHFNRQCKKVYDWLMADVHITVLFAINNGVASLPRRILDLKKSGVLISEYWKQGVKVWHMDQAQKDFNNGRF